MRAYYPYGEVNKKVAEIMQKLDPVHAGAFVHSSGKNDFMSFMSEKIPSSCGTSRSSPTALCTARRWRAT